MKKSVRGKKAETSAREGKGARVRRKGGRRAWLKKGRKES